MDPLQLEELAETFLDAAMAQQNAVWPDAPTASAANWYSAAATLKLRVGTNDGKRFTIMSQIWHTSNFKAIGESVIDETSEACDIIDALMECIKSAETSFKPKL